MFHFINSNTIYDPELGAIFEFNDVGIRIFCLVIEKAKMKDIQEYLIKECKFDIPEAKETALEFYKKLESLGLIQVDKFNPFKFIGWDITYFCNLSCSHCYLGTHKESKDQDGREILIAKRIVESGTKLVEISGGEPFTNKFLFPVLDILKENNIGFILRTNGTLINKDIANEISNYDNLIQVFVSLDGPDERINSILRGKDSFDKILLGIRNLITFDISVGVVYALHEGNIDKVEECIELCAKEGVSVFTLSHLYNQGRAKENKIYVSNERRISFLKMTENLRKKYQGRICIPSELWAISLGLDTKSKTVGCGMGRGNVIITPDGSVLPCRRCFDITDAMLGSVIDKSLQEIYNSEKAAYFRSFNVNNLEDCNDCYYKDVCGGLCRLEAFSATGSFAGKDPFCEIYRRFLEENFPHSHNS